MASQILLPAKATAVDERSNAIVVSFEAKWHEHLLARDFSLVIRKRVPKNRTFEWLYFHINSPVSSICGRAPIENVNYITMEEAITRAKELNLSPVEINSYIAEGMEIGCYQLGAFEFGERLVSSTELSTRMIYHPPQSFFVLSRKAKETIDRMAGFRPFEAGQLRKVPNQ
jgi:hypothetical protein